MLMRLFDAITWCVAIAAVVVLVVMVTGCSAPPLVPAADHQVRIVVLEGAAAAELALGRVAGVADGQGSGCVVSTVGDGLPEGGCVRFERDGCAVAIGCQGEHASDAVFILGPAILPGAPPNPPAEPRLE